MLKSGLCLSRAAENSVRASLQRRLAVAVEHVAHYEWQVFLNTPFLDIPLGSDEAKIHLQELFFDRCVEHQILTLADSYPELIRIWLVQIENWRRFFQTFTRDAAKFTRRMKWNGKAKINRLQTDLSDLHDGNTTVIHVRFVNGEDWFYKPRPLAQGAAWFKLLSLINQKGFSHAFEVPRAVSGKKSHWMETIAELRCVGYRQQRNFCFRMGALFYLLNLLQGVDFHTGNLLCHADQPVFVDCETLMHPETPMPRRIAAQERGLFRGGVLPLAGRAGSRVAALGPMTFARVSPRRRRLPLEITCRSVTEGFRAMHEFLTGAGGCLSILHKATAQLRAKKCRIIYRPTALYHSILQRSLSPEMLTDTTKRWAFLRRACRTYVPRFVADKEAKALKNLDIPLLIGRCAKPSRLCSDSDVKRANRQIALSLAKCLGDAFDNCSSILN